MTHLHLLCTVHIPRFKLLLKIFHWENSELSSDGHRPSTPFDLDKFFNLHNNVHESLPQMEAFIRISDFIITKSGIGPILFFGNIETVDYKGFAIRNPILAVNLGDSILTSISPRISQYYSALLVVRF